MTKCLNCGHSVTGHFCSNCGQKADIARISIRELTTETLHFFTHFEKGFLYTSVQFLGHPGSAGQAYLQGKRRKFQTPVSYLFIWTGLYILLHNFIIHYHDYHVVAGASTLKDQANVLLRTHFTPFILIILLLSAVVIYLVLGRPVFNLGEILILSLYGGGTYFMLLFFSDVFLGLVLRRNILASSVFVWQTTVSAFYNWWFQFSVFKRSGVRWLLFRILITSLVIAAIGLLLMLYLPRLWIRWMH